MISDARPSLDLGAHSFLPESVKLTRDARLSLLVRVCPDLHGRGNRKVYQEQQQELKANTL
jgi:hypothetical protein